MSIPKFFRFSEEKLKYMDPMEFESYVMRLAQERLFDLTTDDGLVYCCRFRVHGMGLQGCMKRASDAQTREE